jgi:hypothetical protein
MFNSKNIDNLQFNIIQNNEAIVFESLIKILGMIGISFLKKWQSK